jgi:hypothetical protein
MSYLASNFHIIFEKLCEKNKPIENCHVENVVLGKDFNLGTTSSLFHVFTPRAS